MDQTELLETVSDRAAADADEDTADDATRAVLQTLGERLSADEAEKLAANSQPICAGLSRRASRDRISPRRSFSPARPAPGHYQTARRRSGDDRPRNDPRGGRRERTAVVDQFRDDGFESPRAFSGVRTSLRLGLGLIDGLAVILDRFDG